MSELATSDLRKYNYPKDGNITFSIDDKEIMRFENNGDIFREGKLIGNDQEIIEGLGKFLNEWNEKHK